MKMNGWDREEMSSRRETLVETHSVWLSVIRWRKGNIQRQYRENIREKKGREINTNWWSLKHRHTEWRAPQVKEIISKKKKKRTHDNKERSIPFRTKMGCLWYPGQILSWGLSLSSLWFCNGLFNLIDGLPIKSLSSQGEGLTHLKSYIFKLIMDGPRDVRQERGLIRFDIICSASVR